MSKDKKLTPVSSNGGEPKPVQREVRITRTQAAAILDADRAIGSLQQRMNALVTATLAGHDISEAREVKFVGMDTAEPALGMLDYTGVAAWRAKHQPKPEPAPEEPAV